MSLYLTHNTPVGDSVLFMNNAVFCLQKIAMYAKKSKSANQIYQQFCNQNSPESPAMPQQSVVDKYSTQQGFMQVFLGCFL
ncbi:hypothetical protein U27_05428 [Candidatus Vecturithrix granuli]|uniref:Uncharacterized protein n=1 Tax=Vecturithrix granuli TaxID=1499967 RepID=A0A081C1J9_VECG1|nr:hypothetical protein U27_05428 [Candidatus Vecturithrix granuli]